MAAAEICHDNGISDATFCQWRAKFGCMDVSEARRLRELEAENAEVTYLPAEPDLDTHALRKVCINRPKPCLASA